MRRSSSTTGPTWATRWSCTTDARRALLITTEHRGRAGTERFRPALSCLCLCLWLRWCSGRRLILLWGRAAWCARGRRPAREPSAPAAQPEFAIELVACGSAGVPGAVGPGRPRDRHTRACGSEWSISKPARALRILRRPPHRRCLWFWCARPDPAAAHGRRSQAPPPPTGAAARPSCPSGALHTGGVCGSGVPGPRRRLWVLRRVLVQEISPQLGALVRGTALR